MYIRAERTADWSLHLYCIQAMVPHFNAGGNIHYAKAAPLYLQQMHDLPNKIPPEGYRKITEDGYFTVRRRHEFWSGIWTDMVIEQDLMRAMKSQGGVTRGRGLTESVLIQWVMSSQACLELRSGLEKFTGVHRNTSEQHVDLRESRRKKDGQHLAIFISWLNDHDPFDCSQDGLRSLSTGTTGDSETNCDRAVIEGKKSMQRMVGQTYGEVKMKRTEKVKTLAAASAAEQKPKREGTINATFLLMKICFSKKTSDEDMKEIMTYDLAEKSPTLFDEVGLMRHNAKAKFSLNWVGRVFSHRGSLHLMN